MWMVMSAIVGYTHRHRFCLFGFYTPHVTFDNLPAMGDSAAGRLFCQHTTYFVIHANKSDFLIRIWIIGGVHL